MKAIAAIGNASPDSGTVTLHILNAARSHPSVTADIVNVLLHSGNASADIATVSPDIRIAAANQRTER